MREKRLIVVADYTCPWCYLAYTGAARLGVEGVSADGAAFELRPPGSPLEADRDDAWWRAVELEAERLGVPIRRPALMTRTRKAHEAAAFARSEGRFAAMHGAIFDAYWQGGLDIGRIDVLVSIGRAAGLDAGRLRVALDIDQWTDRVQQDEAWSARLGLAGVPAYVLTDGTGVAADIRVGLREHDELKAWVEHDDI